MKSKLSFAIVLVVLCAILSPGTVGNVRAQQGEERGPGLEQLSNLTSYQGVEAMPRFEGDEPAPEALPPASPEVSVPWSQIVFQSARNMHGWEIYLADGSGNNQTQLTWNSIPDIHARLNRGCSKIVFASERPSKNYNIFVMNVDSSGVTQLTGNSKDDVYPAWSPDGTSIAFQAYRDGNPEIYLMNADGSNQTRLTESNRYDGTPAWSPDGRIVFASDRVGSGGIWVMNSDGSGLSQLAGQPYSVNPAWSPDGSQIAYSADDDGDGWYEMWLMNADGSEQHQLLDLGYRHDAWVRSWSPDGRYIAYTQITFIIYNGTLYWTEAYLYAWDVQSNSGSLIASNDTEWHPDWQTTDGLPPVSSINALPAQSPASFTVSWTGNDEGPTGIRNYDVQIKVGADGAWADWLMATASTSWGYQGLGGQTYYFRVRARDNGWNLEAWPAVYDAMTTVEALPPQAFIKPLPDYLKRNSRIEWGGIDPGGSGIKEYDVQFRDLASGDWDNLATATQATSAYFNANMGNTYSFRTRAVDNATNQGLWSSENEDTSTTLYEWGIWGTVNDNSGVQVANADVNTTPEAFVKFPSDEQGRYAAYLVEAMYFYPVSWDKYGYGVLPVTNFDPNLNKPVEVVLPLIDNFVQNWGFEQNTAITNWDISGLYPAVITDVVQHSGLYAARLGSQNQGFAPPINISDVDNNDDDAPDMVLDKLGVLHTIWQSQGGANEILYARRGSNGEWAAVENVSQSPENATNPKIGVDDAGVVHAVWCQLTAADTASIYYSQRAPGGSWLAPQKISVDYGLNRIFDSKIAVASDGAVHALWVAFEYSANHFLVYDTSRDKNGVWSVPQPISDSNIDSFVPLAAVDNSGNLHVVWQGTDHTRMMDIFYAQRKRNGIWSSQYNVTYYQGIYDNATNPQIALEGSGALHISWMNSTSGITYYIQKKADGTWIDPEVVPTNGYLYGAYNMALDKEGNIHTAWFYDSNTRDVFYSMRDILGGWSKPENVSNDYSNPTGGDIKLAIGEDGIVHVVWTAGSPYFDILYARRVGADIWTTRQNISNTDGPSLNPKIAIDDSAKAHVIWNGSVGWNDTSYIWYAGPAKVPETGESTLSQSIILPATLTNPVLSFLYQLEGASATGGSGLSVLVQDKFTATILLSTTENTSDWTHAWFDLSPWISQTITLTFNVHEVEGYLYTWANLDEVTVGSAHPDVWVSALCVPAAMPGDTVTLQLSYGNRSPVADAISAMITATLPAGLIFESASLTPTVNGNVLTWQVGDLPAESGPFTILVTATVAGDAALGSVLTVPVEISSTSPELELVNNQKEFMLYIGSWIYLPLLVR